MDVPGGQEPRPGSDSRATSPHVSGDRQQRPGKGERRRRSLVRAAAQILLTEGPGGLTHRSVAARAGSSLSATTYYFTSLQDLLTAAGEHIVRGWAEHAEHVAERERARWQAGERWRAADRWQAGSAGDPSQLSTALLDALLPSVGQVRGHYEQLLTAGTEPRVARAYRFGRHRLDEAVAQILATYGSPCPPDLAVAVIDGAVLSALSEGRDVYKTASALLARVL